MVQMAENSFLARDVDLASLAERTKNFSGAEIEGLVKDAAAYALNRQVDFSDLHKPLDEENIKVTMKVRVHVLLCVHICVCGGGEVGSMRMGRCLPACRLTLAGAAAGGSRATHFGMVCGESSAMQCKASHTPPYARCGGVVDP